MSINRQQPRFALPVVVKGCLTAVGLCWLGSGSAFGAEFVIRDALGLRSALKGVQEGSVLRLAPGDYGGGYHVVGVARLTVEALDPEKPPVFQGGPSAWHFSRCEYLTLRNLRIRGQSSNGLNLDDGGAGQSLVKGITIESVEVTDIGPVGNHDAIKCSGLSGLTIRNCTISGWGGQGIDFVGCHKSLITGCQFLGKEGFSASAGVQLKGGTSEVTVGKCHFVDAGERPINAGGSTGLPFFRPPGARHEAKNLIIRDNVIEGSSCAVAFVGVDGAEFSDNRILYPKRWLFRILQETQEAEFVPCRNVVLKRNQFIFRRADLRTDVNVGAGTEPATFRFEGNHWYAEDRPESSRPQLPAAEKEGVYGKDPR